MNPSKLSPAELDRHAAKLAEDGYTIIPEVLSRRTWTMPGGPSTKPWRRKPQPPSSTACRTKTS